MVYYHYLCIVIINDITMTDNDFDLNAQDIDQYCVTHDIDDYDLFGEIMAEDGDSSGFGDDIEFE